MSLPEEKICTEDDYYNLSEDVRAELINGQIYYHAAPSRIHQEVLMELAGTIRNYIRDKNGPCKVYPAPFAVKLSAEEGTTIVEPDISVICNPDKLTDRGCTGAPDWIIEIVSPCNSSHDYVLKLNKYMTAGVREYWIVNPQAYTVLVYHFEEANLTPKAYTFNDRIKVNIYDDLYLDFKVFNL